MITGPGAVVEVSKCFLHTASVAALSQRSNLMQLELTGDGE